MTEGSTSGRAHGDGKAKGAMANAARVARHTILSAMWIGAVTKLLIADWDVALLENVAPHYVHLLNYRLFILLFALAVLWMIAGTSRFLLGVLYVVCYPVLAVGWCAWQLSTRLVFQSWYSALASFLAVVSILRSGRFWFCSIALGITSGAVVYWWSNDIARSFGMLYMLLLAFVLLIRPLYLSFRTKSVLSQIAQYIADKWPAQRDTWVRSQVKDSPVPTEKELQERRNSTALWLLFAAFCVCVGSKLSSTKRGHIMALQGTVSFTFIAIAVVTVFGFLYYGLNQLDPTSFSDHQAHGLLFFLWFSLCTALDCPAAPIVATAPLARFVVSLQYLSVWVLIVLVLLVLFNVFAKRQDDEVALLAKRLCDEGNSIYSELSRRCSLSLIEVREESKRGNPSLYALVIKLDPAVAGWPMPSGNAPILTEGTARPEPDERRRELPPDESAE